MNSGDFESELRRQPVRPVPGEWRGEVLAAAGTVISNQRSVISGQSAVSRLRTDATTGQGSELSAVSSGKKTGTDEDATSRTTRATPSLLSTINTQLSAILWPHPVAWAGLAGVWLVITALNWSATGGKEMAERKSAPPAPDLIMAMQEQRRALARLIENTEPPPVEPPKPTEPRPRGELKMVVVVV